MAYMTDEEAKRLDEKWTKNPPKPGPNGTGYFTQCKKTAHTITIDNITANEENLYFFTTNHTNQHEPELRYLNFISQDL